MSFTTTKNYPIQHRNWKCMEYNWHVKNVNIWNLCVPVVKNEAFFYYFFSELIYLQIYNHLCCVGLPDILFCKEHKNVIVISSLRSISINEMSFVTILKNESDRNSLWQRKICMRTQDRIIPAIIVGNSLGNQGMYLWQNCNIGCLFISKSRSNGFLVDMGV